VALLTAEAEAEAEAVVLRDEAIAQRERGGQ
jgi:hypothetical protein